VDVYQPVISYPISEGVTLSLQASCTTLFFPEGCDHVEITPYNPVLATQGVPQVVQGFQELSLERGEMRAIRIRDETLRLRS
jgi:hypothetical protein